MEENLRVFLAILIASNLRKYFNHLKTEPYKIRLRLKKKSKAVNIRKCPLKPLKQL